MVNTPWNSRIDAFGQVNVGFSGTSTGTPGKPSALTLNDIDCAVA